MKYVISWLMTTAVFLGFYYVAFMGMVFADFVTNGISTYTFLAILAAVSGLMGPVLLFKEKSK